MTTGPDCMTIKSVKARKPHKCCECAKVIEAGDFYMRTSGVWDGRPDTFKACYPCHALYGEAYAQNLKDGGTEEHAPPLGGLFEWIANFYPGGWTAEAKKRIAVDPKCQIPKTKEEATIEAEEAERAQETRERWGEAASEPQKVIFYDYLG